MSDLVRTVASVFRRKGATEIPSAEFKHALSLDLRWFAPADAKKLVAHAADVGLLEEAGDRVRAKFDVARIEVPVAFRPTLDVLDERPALPAPAPVPKPAGPAVAPEPAAPPTPGGEALREAAKRVGEDLAALTKEADEERERRGGLLTPEVAALVVARRHGVEVRALAGRVLAEL